MELVARGVTVRRGGRALLSGVELAGRAGELVGVLGPSGSGKSTLLYALAGFRPVDAGSVRWGGAAMDAPETRLGLGFVPQDDVVPEALRVERVLHYAAELRLPDLTAEVRAGRLGGVLVKLGLEEHRRKRVSQLSGGQRKRVSVAVELLARPSLLFADEPTSGLDPALEHDLMALLKQMTGEGRLVVVTTHIMSSLRFLDQVAVLHGGMLAYFGPPGEVKRYFGVEDYADLYRELGRGAAESWRDRYRQSSLYREHLRPRLGGEG